MSRSRERTQSLDSQWSGSNQGPTGRGHPDSCASLAELQAETAAARDKLMSEVGSLLARSLMSRSEELERSTIVRSEPYLVCMDRLGPIASVLIVVCTLRIV